MRKKKMSCVTLTSTSERMFENDDGTKEKKSEEEGKDDDVLTLQLQVEVGLVR